MKLTIPDRNTRFARPIVCPTTGEHVSAETLYNRCCAALGSVQYDHIGDLILDNLQYGTPMGEVETDEMCKAIYAWADGVRAQIKSKSEAMPNKHVAAPFRAILNSICPPAPSAPVEQPLRDVFAQNVMEAIVEQYPTIFFPKTDISIGANTSDCPVIRVDLGNGEIYNVTITRARR